MDQSKEKVIVEAVKDVTICFPSQSPDVHCNVATWLELFQGRSSLCVWS